MIKYTSNILYNLLSSTYVFSFALINLQKYFNKILIIIVSGLILYLYSIKYKILVISSGSAQFPNAGLASYSSAKAAIEMFAKCIFIEQKRLKQVDILALRPGVVNTNMQKRIRSVSKKDFPNSDRYKNLFKQNKLLNPKLVAEKIHFLLSTKKFWKKPVLDISDIKL